MLRSKRFLAKKQESGYVNPSGLSTHGAVQESLRGNTHKFRYTACSGSVGLQNKKGLCTGVPLAEAQSKRHLDCPLHGMPFLSWTRCILENRHWLDDAFSEHDCRSAAFYITTMHEQHKLSNKIINSGTAACPGCPSSGVRPSSGRPHAATSTNNWFIRQTHTLSVVAGRDSCK